MAGQVNALCDQEQQGHAQAAEDLEVDPVALEGERDKQVGGATKQENPIQAMFSRVQTGSGRVRAWPMMRLINN